jgi:hypothetical protein
MRARRRRPAWAGGVPIRDLGQHDGGVQKQQQQPLAAPTGPARGGPQDTH